MHQPIAKKYVCDIIALHQWLEWLKFFYKNYRLVEYELLTFREYFANKTK